jgi:hypothetical protein
MSDSQEQNDTSSLNGTGPNLPSTHQMISNLENGVQTLQVNTFGASSPPSSHQGEVGVDQNAAALRVAVSPPSPSTQINEPSNQSVSL